MSPKRCQKVTPKVVQNDTFWPFWRYFLAPFFSTFEIYCSDCLFIPLLDDIFEMGLLEGT
jgi:hypothetical protein